MIKYNLYDSPDLHPSPQYVNQELTVGDALERLVGVLSGFDAHESTAWVEDVNLLNNPVVKVGWYGMAGEKWIEVFEGSHGEITRLADVCNWYYQATGKASDKYIEEENSTGPLERSPDEEEAMVAVRNSDHRSPDGTWREIDEY
jgi:hypothetical protein